MNRLLLLVLAMMLLATPAAQGQKLTDLTEDTAPTADDIMETTNSPGGTPASRKITLANLPKALLQSIANGHLLYNNNGVFGSPTITTPLAATNGEVTVAGLSSMGTALYMTRVNSGGTAWEYRSPSQVRSDIGALTSTIPGSGSEIPYRATSTTLGASGLTWSSGSSYLGINNASPGAPLDVAGSVIFGTTSLASTSVYVKTTSAGSGLIRFDDGASSGQIIYDHSLNQMYFATSGASRMVIDNNGFVGVGTTTPSKHFNIYSSSTPTAQWTNSTSGTAATDGALVYLSGSNLVVSNQETSGTNQFLAAASTQVPITVKAASAHSANLVEVNSSSGSSGDLFAISSAGNVTSVSYKTDSSVTAGQTRFFLYDVDNAQLERVTVGAADSGGAGFKVLRIPN